MPNERKKKYILTKKVNNINYKDILYLLIMMFVSIFTVIFIFRTNNVLLIRKKPFFVAIVFALLNSMVFNIITGKITSVKNCFYRNLISSVILATTCYDIIYLYLYNTFNFVYLLFLIHFLFSLLLSSLILLVSILKYNNFVKYLKSDILN